MRIAIRLLAIVAAVIGIAACSGADGPGAAGDGSMAGTLAVYIMDDLDGRAETHYALRLQDGSERPLVFATPTPTLSPETAVAPFAPGTPIRVWGSDGAAGLRVDTIRALAADARETGAATAGIHDTRRALIGGPPYPPRSFAFVLVDIGGGTLLSTDAIAARMLTNPDSIRNYYLADSYGRQDVTAQVFGPLPFTMADCSTATLAQMASALRPQITGTFDHYLWFFGTRSSLCPWLGVGALGTAGRPERDTWYNGSTTCIVLVQEPGHNFGMQHSSALVCSGTSFADDPNTCTASEYGDLFDPMGAGCRHMNAWQKDYQGWFGGCNGVRVTASGTFTLLPFEKQCQGAQFLQIPAAHPRLLQRPAAGGGGASIENLAYYYVELRTPIDFDGTLANRTAIAPALLVHAGDDLRTRDQPGAHTYLLDMTPAVPGRTTFNDSGLPAGMTFTDPAGGVSITAVSVSAEQATVTVTIDAPLEGAPDQASGVCLDGSAFAQPGPGPESCGVPVPGSGGDTGSGGGGDLPAATGGSGPTGSGGTTGAPGETSGIAPGGCACATQPARAPADIVATVAIAAALGTLRRRGKRRASPQPSARSTSTGCA